VADEALGRAEEAAARYGFEAYHFLRSVAEGKPHGTTLDDAVRSAAALDAMARSVETGGWVTVGPA
jgi:predicted dehydrogenase